MKLFLAPHNDDETLFGAFTIHRERPVVAVVYDSYIQVVRGADWCDAATRRAETVSALKVLLGNDADVRFCGFRDDRVYPLTEVANGILNNAVMGQSFDGIFAPAHEPGGHVQHNLVADAAEIVARQLGVLLTRYTTYTRTNGKTVGSYAVPASAEGIKKKLLALACYESQIMLRDTQENFTRDLLEYYL
jgi:LmbE family N-acetylglucosaminyl deacetylase